MHRAEECMRMQAAHAKGHSSPKASARSARTRTQSESAKDHGEPRIAVDLFPPFLIRIDTRNFKIDARSSAAELRRGAMVTGTPIILDLRRHRTSSVADNYT